MKRYGAKKLHGVKKFVSTFKYMDVYSAPLGTNVGGYARNNLTTAFNQSPLEPNLSALYRQYMITGIQWIYKPTNVAPNTGDSEFATELLFAEDKATTTALTESQMRSQDNVRMLTTARPFKHYVRLPRPILYQTDTAGAQILVTQGAGQANWINTNHPGLKHLSAQMLVADSTSVVVPAPGVLQGTLWCKLYVVVKEQSL